MSLTNDGIFIHLPDDDPIELARTSEITDALADIRKTHEVAENWILVPDPDVGYELVIGAIDAARAASFTYVTVAGGVK